MSEFHLIIENIAKNKYLSSTELDKPIEWPALIVCKMPRDKNEAKYLEFIGKGITESFENMEEFEKLKNETFYSDVKDIIYAVTIADSYLKGIYRINEIPIEPPYVTSMLVDFYYLGYCAKISFEHLRPFLVKKGEIKKEDIDPSFVATLFLKVSE